MGIQTAGIVDLAPIASLKNLQTIKVDRIRISASDFGSSLRIFEIAETHSELSTIVAGMTELRTMTLGEFRSEDVQTVAQMATLEKLALLLPHEDQDQDIAWSIPSLSSLTNLTRLRLATEQVLDTSPLGSLRRLRELTMLGRPEHLHPRDFFGFLVHLGVLERFEYAAHDALSANCDYVSVTTLKSLLLRRDGHDRIPHRLPEKLLLRNLGLQCLEIDEGLDDTFSLPSLKILKRIPRLHELRIKSEVCRQCQTKHFWKPLETLRELRRLELRNATFSYLALLEKMTGLVELKLIGMRNIRDISALRGLVLLEELDLDETHVAKITPLRALTRLRRLRLAEKVDCSPVAQGKYKLPCLVQLLHPERNCLGNETRKSTLRPRKRRRT